MPLSKKTSNFKKKTVKKSSTSLFLNNLKLPKFNLKFRPKKISDLPKTPLFLIAVFLIGGFIYLLSKWLVVAWVDQRPITRVQLLSQLEEKFGENLKDQLISEALIINEAKRRGVSVSEDEINKDFGQTEQQVGGKQMLLSLLARDGTTEEEFRKRIMLQILVQKMFSDGVNVSEDEINKYLEENKDSLPPEALQADMSSTVSSQLRIEITDQLKNQKISQAFRTWLEDTKNSSRVIKI